MNKVRTRAYSVLLLVAIALLGMGFLVVRYFINGTEWATVQAKFNEEEQVTVLARFNRNVYQNGRLVAYGIVTDRNGVLLAGSNDGIRTFAESADVRRSTLHAVGDMHGNIGTAALSVFSSDLMGYNLINGIFSVSGAGRQISLTIDSQLNKTALQALDGRRGVVIVSNYETGEIICMVSSPTFDPANPPESFDNSRYEGVFLNRAIQSTYTPGSTFKLVTAAAAIERVNRVWEREFLCTGQIQIGADTLICPREHGSLDFARGLQVSCNIVFGELSLDLGANTLASYTERFGLSGRTTVSGLRTAEGNFDKALSGFELAWSGVGQFTNMVNPASMLRFVGAIANNGNAANLYYMTRTGISSITSGSTDRILSTDTAELLGEMMEVQNRDSFPGLDIYAKSGTAQVGGGRDPHAWYTGYITNEGYPLAFVVIVENGGSGTGVAAPIANRVLQEAIDR